MAGYIFQKFFYGLLVMWGVVTAIFFLFNVLPGDPARLMLGQRADKESIEMINRDLGRDKPISIQYLMYLNDLSIISIHKTKDQTSFLYLSDEKYTYTKLFVAGTDKVFVLKFPYLRRSYQNKEKVWTVILERLPETAVLAFASILIASLLGILIGVFAALKKNSFFDKSSLVFATIFMSGPSFYIGLIFMVWFGYTLGDFTGLNPTGSLFEMDLYGGGEQLMLKNLVLPALTLGLRPLAIIIQLTRSSMLDILSQDYIRTATAKGLGFYSVVFKHALKNALSPVITAISGWFAGLMAGTVFVEDIFGWQGIGHKLVSSLLSYDLPVVMGCVLVVATIFVIINTTVDIVYGLLDPRVRIK